MTMLFVYAVCGFLLMLFGLMAFAPLMEDIDKMPARSPQPEDRVVSIALSQSVDREQGATVRGEIRPDEVIAPHERPAA